MSKCPVIHKSIGQDGELKYNYYRQCAKFNRSSLSMSMSEFYLVEDKMILIISVGMRETGTGTIYSNFRITNSKDEELYTETIRESNPETATLFPFRVIKTKENEITKYSLVRLQTQNKIYEDVKTLEWSLTDMISLSYMTFIE